MTTPIQSQDQDEQLSNLTQIVDNLPSALSSALPLHVSAPQPVVLPSRKESTEEESFYFEEEQPDLVGPPFVTPFQLSTAMPTIAEQPRQQANQVSDEYKAPTPPPVKKASRKTRFSLTIMAIIICTVVIIGMVVMNALAQATLPLQTQRSSQTLKQQGPSQNRPTATQQKPTAKPALGPTNNGTNGQGQNQGQQNQGRGQNPAATDWVPQQLPNGWANAGLQTGDGIQSIRTAVTFNDREMSVDSRSVGTRNNHAGTLTAATFVMTAAARQRFVQNDIRESNNTFFDMVVNTQLTRLVANPQPQLVNFAQQGQQQFAWVDVAFQLWQSQIVPNNPQQRIEGKELDPATNQPRVHHMMVLLLRVPSQDAGNNPAMGGTGWLVSNYALDQPNGTALDIVQPA